jgi:hypothetical protein
MIAHNPALVPFTELELDCVQNLFATLLMNYGFELRYLGAAWPWEFNWNAKDQEMWKPLRLMASKCVSKERMMSLYHASAVYHYPGSESEVMNYILEYSRRHIPVIVCVDQFYVPYHYPYIYQQRHGLHTTMITGEGKTADSFTCISAIPVYQGDYSMTDLKQGIAACNVKWLSVLECKDMGQAAKEGDVYQEFITRLTQVRQNYEESAAVSGKCYAPWIICILQELLQQKDIEEIRRELELICDGTWGWTVDRKGAWLNSYLAMTEVKARNSSVMETLPLVEANSNNWMVAYRLLFKASQSKDVRKPIIKAIEKLQIIVEQEKGILERLIGSP